MDWHNFLAFWRPIWSVMTVLALWGIWSLRKITASKHEFHHLESRINNNEKFIELVEEKCASRQDLHKLALRISAIKATQKAQNQQLSDISNAVRRIENYWLDFHK